MATCVEENSSSDEDDILIESVKDDDSILILLDSSKEEKDLALEGSDSSESCIMIDEKTDALTCVVLGDIPSFIDYPSFKEGQKYSSTPRREEEVYIPQINVIEADIPVDLVNSDASHVMFVEDSSEISIDKAETNINVKKYLKSESHTPLSGGCDKFIERKINYLRTNVANVINSCKGEMSSAPIVHTSKDAIVEEGKDLECNEKEEDKSFDSQMEEDIASSKVGESILPEVSVVDQLAMSSDEDKEVEEDYMDDDKISLAPSLDMFDEEEFKSDENNNATNIDASIIDGPSSHKKEESKSQILKNVDPRLETFDQQLKKFIPKMLSIPTRQKIPLDIEEDKLNVKDEDTGLDVFSFGNYCHQVVSGELCSKLKCSWVHYMAPDHAVQQLYRISAHRPLDDLLAFFRFFTNPDVQETLWEEAHDLMGRDETCAGHLELCQAVFKAMVRVSGDRMLEADICLEMVETSNNLFSFKDVEDVFVQIFSVLATALRNGSPNECFVLIKWAWEHMYLASLDVGKVLPIKFYSDLLRLLNCQDCSEPQLAEVMLYTALVPSLQVDMSCLYHLLEGSPPPALSDIDCAVFTGRSIATITITQWQSLSQLGDIKPGLTDLATALFKEDPLDVNKFFSNLPDGLELPTFQQPGPDQLQLWVRHCVSQGRWQDLAARFSSLPAKNVEGLAELTETILDHLSPLAGKRNLKQIFSILGTSLGRHGSPIHHLFLSQLGVGLLVSLASVGQWDLAWELLQYIASHTNFLHMKLPQVGMFSQLTNSMIPLTVLEVMLRVQRREELLNTLSTWNCLDKQTDSNEEINRRDLLFIRVLSFFLDSDLDHSNIVTAIKISDIVTPTMKSVTDSNVRKSHESLSNKLLVQMLNLNIPGPDLWSRYLSVRSCRHQLTKAVGRGLVFRFSYNRLLDQAIRVYQSAVKWGLYSVQISQSRPLKLLLNSNQSLEEIYVVVREFLGRLDKSSDSLQVFISMHETSIAEPIAIRSLENIRSSKEEAMARVKNTLRMLVPPLSLTMGSLPYIPHQMVWDYCNEL